MSDGSTSPPSLGKEGRGVKTARTRSGSPCSHEEPRPRGSAGAARALRGKHLELGPVTLGQLLATWVAHDLDHVSQIVRVMAKQYTAAVGPWAAYLRVVRP